MSDQKSRYCLTNDAIRDRIAGKLVSDESNRIDFCMAKSRNLRALLTLTALSLPVSAVGQPIIPNAPSTEIAAVAATDKDTVSFSVEMQGLVTNFHTFFAPVMPGEILNIQVRGRPQSSNYVFDSSISEGVLADELKLAWKAPDDSGLYPITVTDADTGEVMTINVFVLEPASNIEDGKLNGYRIGAYPDKPLRGNSAYANPLGFIEVTDALANTKVSPNFTVGQFLCKQTTSADVKYVVLKPTLLMKLERVVDLVNENGIDTDSLFVMSGYRTPYYNAAIGNVQYSRHVFGDAADVYVDYAPRDGDMDDINRDGVVNRKDAAHLFDLVDAFDRDKVELTVQGGIGEYDRNAAHGPFVHIDVRGVPARWGR